MISMATSQLRIITFNCHGLKSSVPYISTLCDNNDIVFLQETWLAVDELVLLKQIHPDFTGYQYGVSAMDMSDGILKGRPHGGLGILYRKKFSKCCHKQTKKALQSFEHKMN